jgi:hypothetical protein
MGIPIGQDYNIVWKPAQRAKVLYNITTTTKTYANKYVLGGKCEGLARDYLLQSGKLTNIKWWEMQITAVSPNIVKVCVEILVIFGCLCFINESSHQFVSDLLDDMFPINEATLKKEKNI